MNKKTNEELQAFVDKATAGDKKALETLVAGVQDMAFNLSLRMLGTFADAEDATQDILLKMSCTNVMLQCLDTESRCIFILGTMFKVDSRIAGDILGMTPEAYRQRLSRIRKKMADFLGQYCGEYGAGRCKCKERVNYAIQNHRINPQ